MTKEEARKILTIMMMRLLSKKDGGHTVDISTRENEAIDVVGKEEYLAILKSVMETMGMKK